MPLYRTEELSPNPLRNGTPVGALGKEKKQKKSIVVVVSILYAIILRDTRVTVIAHATRVGLSHHVHVPRTIYIIWCYIVTTDTVSNANIAFNVHFILLHLSNVKASDIVLIRFSYLCIQ